MIWQVWADIAIGLAVPVITIILFFSGRIQRKHLLLMVWGFAVGSTWEFAFYFLGDKITTTVVEWPLPLITKHLSHTFWDAGIFIIGYWLCLFILRTSDCCTRFRWSELAIMWLWGNAQEFVIDLMGSGVIWEYKVYSWNPVWLSIGEKNLTLLAQLIWMIAPIVYYLGFIRINRE